MVQSELNNVYMNISAYKDSETYEQKHCNMQNLIQGVSRYRPQTIVYKNIYY